MGTRIIYTCDRCGREIESYAEGYTEWREIVQFWVGGSRVSRDGVILCSLCLQEMGLKTLFYPEEG